MDMPVDYHVLSVGTLSNTRAKADQHHAELNDRFVDHTELFVSRFY